MDSPLRSIATLVLAGATAFLAAWYGTGLDPLWWATWLLPAAGFVAAAQVRGRRGWLPGAVAMFAGELNLWTYLAFIPLPVRLLLLLIPALAFGAVTGWFASAVQRGRIWLALAGPAAAWVAYEYLYSKASPHSTFGALAYSQANCLPILQLSAVGGIWMIDGLVFVVGAAAALAVSGGFGARRRLQVGCVALIALGGAAGFGFLRLRPTDDGPAVTVGLIASDRNENMWFGAPPASAAIARRYLAHVPALRAAGAEWVVLPEHLLALRESDPDRNAPQIESMLHACAAANRVTIVVGVDRRDPAGVLWNEARLYRPDGQVVTYQKHHLLPGPESPYTPGHAYTVLDRAEGKFGLAICKDLDFPAMGRAYGERKVAALIVPAFDFTVDGWLHSRMAMVRGVESGFALVRVAKRGRLTVSDSRGRVLAERRSDAAEFATLVARCPLRAEHTWYARWGDWFAWLACGVAAWAMMPWRRWTQRARQDRNQTAS